MPGQKGLFGFSLWLCQHALEKTQLHQQNANNISRSEGKTFQKPTYHSFSAFVSSRNIRKYEMFAVLASALATLFQICVVSGLLSTNMNLFRPLRAQKINTAIDNPSKAGNVMLCSFETIISDDLLLFARPQTHSLDHFEAICEIAQISI